jgi:ATP-dependent DNA helicase 2 subunit 2
VGKEHEGVLKYKPGGGKSSQDNDATPDGDEANGHLGVQVQGADYEKQFKLLGFTDQSKVPRHHFLGGVDIILPVRGSKNEKAFAALVAAMIEGKKVLIARIIERKNAEPKLVVLYPWVSKRKPLLYMAQLPTAEDLRDYQFPSLIPASEPQRQAARELIKTLDLTKNPGEPEGE